MIPKCKICGSENDIHKHHIQYHPEKLIFVCRSCHSKIHHSKKHKEQELYKYLPTKRQLSYNNKWNVQLDAEYRQKVKKIYKHEKRNATDIIKWCIDYYIEKEFKNITKFGISSLEREIILRTPIIRNL